VSRLQLTARVASDDVPKVESLLELAGAESLSLEDAADEPLFEPSPGATPLWPKVIVKALFGADADVERIRALLADALSGRAELAVEPLADADWQAAGLARTAPRRIGRRLLLAAADDAAHEEAAATLRLHMGLAFGTGEHPTTALCLEWIESSLAPGSVVLDYGCGSGVLALAALRLGAAHAFAVDNDPQAVAATARNAALNGLEQRLWIGEPDALPPFRADVVLANVLAQPLIARAAYFADRLVARGLVILSGVLAVQGEEVVAAYDRRFEDVALTERDGWMRIVARKRMPC